MLPERNAEPPSRRNTQIPMHGTKANTTGSARPLPWGELKTRLEWPSLPFAPDEGRGGVLRRARTRSFRTRYECARGLQVKDGLKVSLKSYEKPGG